MRYILHANSYYDRKNFTGDWFDALRTAFMFNLRPKQKPFTPVPPPPPQPVAPVVGTLPEQLIGSALPVDGNKTPENHW